MSAEMSHPKAAGDQGSVPDRLQSHNDESEEEHSLVHRITEWQGLEGTSVGHLVQPSC